MKRLTWLAILASSLSFAGTPKAKLPEDPATRATVQDIAQTLGMVPTFLKMVPPEALPGAWEDFKNFQLNPKTAVPGKYKELIGIAVSAQIPCQYCSFFHTEAARLNGATEREIREAVMAASMTRRWSTILNGNSLDEATFMKEVSQMMEHMKDPNRTVSTENTVTDENATYQDMRKTFGILPSFARLYPVEAIAGAWKQMKDFQMSPNTAINGKYKELIGVGVAAQVPCKYCVHFHTQCATLQGATETELHETVAMAAEVRHWSTFLNGMQMPMATFQKEVRQVFALAKKKMEKERTTTTSSL